MMITRTVVLELNVARMEDSLVGDTPEQRFDHFLRRLQDPQIAGRLLDEYPVLKEQVEGKLNRWAEYAMEFLQDLCADWMEIRQTFFPNKPGVVTSTVLGAGDTHRGGRSVILVRFSTGARLVYKPRTLAVDEHFHELLNWLNEKGAEPPLKGVRALDKGQHGWVEFVDRTGCENLEHVKRFYQRQGAYVALLYVLEAADFHCENLIAVGENPMLIDLEALFHPRFADEDAESVYSALGRSALKVGMLPARFWVGEESSGIDMSGLGSAAGQQIPHGVPQWERADTDEMHLVKKAMEMPGAQNRPTLNGHEVDALDYVDEIVEGFARMYRLLLRERDGMLDLVQTFANDELRVIVRGTHVYASILHQSYHPDVLRQRGERESLFDSLGGMAEFHEAEKADLIRGDIPFFTTRPASRDVWTSDGDVIASHFRESGLKLVSKRLLQLSEKDLERQLWIVRASLATLSSVTEGPSMVGIAPRSQRESTGNELTAAACRIGDRLEDLALGGDEVSWVGLTPQDEKIWNLAPLEIDFYDGLPGVIFYLAYLGKISGNVRYTKLAQSALRSLRRLMAERSGLSLVGAFIGWGGLIYCYSHLAELWQDEQLFVEAENAMQRAAALVANDQHLDVIGGVAGLALTLLSLKSKDVAAVAGACGKRLAENIQITDHGTGWFREDVSACPLTGFAHGNAGIGYSLSAISKLTGEAIYSEAARWAFDYERSCYSTERGNWPDFRKNRTQDYLTAWCHGAPGIALTRLAALKHSHDSHLQTEIQDALTATATQRSGGSHCLCHGRLGNLEPFILASQVLQKPDYLGEARLIAGGILDDVGNDNWICGNALGVESPGLMTGIAGIGYGLLRLAAPERVPSLLTLEPPRSV